MARPNPCWLISLAILLLLTVIQCSQADQKSEIEVKVRVFLSPKITLEPGLVSDKFYYGIDFPKGHIAIKSFNGELVDEQGNSIPLHQTYLHHWVVRRYYQLKGTDSIKVNGDMVPPDRIDVKNSGMCDSGLTQYFGVGSETRKTETYVPDPYGIEVGNPDDVPYGYVEKWMVNVHAIDTRGAEDKLACTECTCDLYNVTVDQYGNDLPPGYNGGLLCCHDEARCRVKQGFHGLKRNLYLRYTVKYVDWDASILPVRIYILDVTDIWTKGNESRGISARHLCLFEYEVESCPLRVSNDGCVHTKTLTVNLPTGGDVIYGVGHQHSGGVGTTLYGEGGRVICSSNPIYGKGNEPGNETGYVVGMSTCYPSPGSVKISAGETLTFESYYSNAKRHTGVMGLFYILVADSSPKPNTLLHALAQGNKTSNLGWGIGLIGVALVLVFILGFLGSRGTREGYEAI